MSLVMTCRFTLWFLWFQLWKRVRNIFLSGFYSSFVLAPGVSFVSEVLAPLTEQERLITSRVAQSGEEGSSRCTVCLGEPATCLFVGCGHVACCQNCVILVPNCPICRARITGVLPLEQLPPVDAGWTLKKRWKRHDYPKMDEASCFSPKKGPPIFF